MTLAHLKRRDKRHIEVPTEKLATMVLNNFATLLGEVGAFNL
jgi:hypothetical protein